MSGSNTSARHGKRIVEGRRSLALAASLAVAAVLWTGTAAAQGRTVSSAIELARQSASMKPGEWVWAPQIAPRGPVLVYVDLSKQLATVYRNGVRIGVATVSSGKPGHQTPTGVFTILQKDAKHRSSTYNNAPMPYQQRLTWDGVALHAGGLPGYPESHGCVHLPMAFARQLFAATKLGTTVIVAGDSVHPVATGGGEVLAPSTLDVTSDGDFWTPEKSPAGPVTIVMSRADQAVIVLRNGVPIGRSAVALPRDDDVTHVLTLAAGTGGAQQWIHAGVAGHENEDGRPVDELARNKVRIPDDFYRRVTAMLQPGATVLVTSAALGDAGTGSRLTVLTGQ
ncbi:L,D-transpeptidase family protein [Massilia dura]|uniref:L,D-transpeptidase family protein n=1 Tax=Pseudoduganella dura TaxID=321982 RepID=A0A6I3XJ48_9BURK|nr:L,D-transpeptidase [Pseudoduganella dura]MUI11735.1 L,D-transpeptidase family protein [Pseudoduganella dura]GGX78704.1 L,D-transpeptidase [Pseudoduganella dura]